MKNIFSGLNRKKVIGIYVNYDSVDLVVLKNTLKGPVLVQFGQTYIYPKDKQEPEIIPKGLPDAVSEQSERENDDRTKTREDYIVEAIKRVLKENNVKAVNIVTAISSEESMVRYFQMPKMPKQEWTSAIDFEAKRYIPFKMEDVASDFQVIQRAYDSSTMDVIFIAVKQKVIEGFVQLFEKAGVRPIVIEPAPFSLIRAFNAADQIDNKVNTAIINIQTKAANINILKNGAPYIIRDIPLDEIKTEGHSLEPVFEKLLAEIKLSFDFFEKQFPAEVIDKIIVYSHAPLENWHEILGKELQVPVEVGDPLRGIRVKKGIVPPRLAISFGLALRGISKLFIDVNLYKEKLLIYKRKELFVKMAFAEASAAVFLLIVLKVIFMRMIAPLNDELNRALSERPKIEVSIKEDDINKLEALKNQMAEKRDFIEKLLSGRTYFTRRWVQLAENMPDKIWLNTVSFQEGMDKKKPAKVFRQLSIKGYCLLSSNTKETEVINALLSKLKTIDAVNMGMTNAEIVSVKKTVISGENAASFEIVFSGS